MSGTTRKLRLSALLAAALPLACWLPAQAGDLEARPSAIDYLSVNEDVEEEIGTINRLLAEHKWRRAVEVCQKFIADPPDGVVKLRKGVYGSARTLCEQKLRTSPAPVRLLYRTLYDPQAEKLYRRALKDRSVATARALVERFALTSPGPNGMNLLAGLLFEKGDVAGAVVEWSRWMDSGAPKSVSEDARRRAAAKIAVAAAKSGNRKALERALEIFGPQGAVVEIGGRRIARAGELKQLAAALAKRGPQARHQAPRAIDLVRWKQQLRREPLRRWPTYYGSSGATKYACHGELSDGVLYVNALEGPYAFDALTGRVLWRRSARNYASSYDSFRPFNYHCRVYPSLKRPGRKVLFVSGGSRLAAHDATTGRAIWSKTRTSFARVKGIGGDPRLRVSFSGPVLCHGLSAYAMLQTSRSEVHLLAFDRSTGALQWRKNVGASIARSGYRASFPTAMLVVGSDLVFCNGRGIIGKCELATGEVRWLVPYRRRSLFVTGRYYSLPSGLRYSPIVSTGDSIVCVAPDSHQALSIRVSDGRVAWRKELKAGQHLLGMLGARGEQKHDRLYVSGQEVSCLRADTGSVLWKWPLPEDESPGLGRVTSRGVVVATHKGLYVLDAVSGELETFLPVDLASTELVSVASDRDSVALLSTSTACLAGGKQRTRELLGEALKKSPGDPWALGGRARLLRSEGKNDQALVCFAEAVRAAKSRQGHAKLAAALERESLRLHHKLFQADWDAGRRIAAFERMLRALRSPGGLAYECRLGFRAEPGDAGPAPHKLIMATGDKLSGKLAAIESGRLTFLVRGEPWQVDVAGARWVILESGFRTAGRQTPAGGYMVFTKGVDVISCDELAAKGAVLHASSRFGKVRLDMPDVAAIACSSAARRPPARAVYVRLRNGDELSGVIRAFDGAEFILDVPFSGKHRVRAEDIYTISNRRRMPPPQTGAAGPGLDYPYPTFGPVREALEP